MKNRTISLLLTFVLVGILVSACSRSSDAQETNQPTNTPAASATETNNNPQDTDRPLYPIVDEVITVRGMKYWNPHWDNGESRVLWNLIESVTNIRLDMTWLADAEQLPVFMAAGDWPDFFFDPLDTTYINEFGVIGGRFVDYTTKLDLMPHLVEAFDMFPDAKKALMQENGGIYNLFTYSPAATSYGNRMHYRTDIMAEHNVPIPTSTEEFHEALTTLKNATGHAPLAPGFPEGWLFASFGSGITMDFDDINNNGIVTWGRVSDQYKNFLKYMNRLYSDGLYHNEYITMDTPTVQALVNEGNFVFAQHELASIPIESFPSGNWDIDVLAPLTSEFNSDRTIATGAAPWGINRGGAINAASPYVDELCKLFDIAYALEEVVPGTGLYGPAFIWGPENVGWAFTNAEKTNHALMIPTEFMGVTYGDVDWSSNSQYEILLYDAGFGLSMVFEFSIVTDGSNGEARQRGAVNNNLGYARSWVFPPMIFTAEEQSVLDSYMVEINIYVEEMHDKFITGVEDIDASWDTFVANLERMNYRQVVEQYQAAYDRWRSR